MLTRPERPALDLGKHPTRDAADHASDERRADDGVVAPARAVIEDAVVREQRGSGGRRRACGGTVDLAVSEDDDVAVVSRPSSSWITVP